MTDAGESPRFVVDGSRDAAMRPVLELAQRAARSTASVLITGESGTGKRSLAQWIHANSARRAGPLVRAGGAAITNALLVSGARDRTPRGVVAEAAGGTLVLDELCDLSHEAQAALIQLLDTPALRATGTAGTRVIATTRHATDQAVRGGKLRAELYYALGVITIAIPPLRERTEDIPALVAALLARSPHGTVAITDAALAWLADIAWLGNVRELETAIERAIALSDDGVIDVEHVAGLAGAARPAASPQGHRRRRSSLR
jgi:two-component system response regulator PilR (NtrC family)